MLRKRQGRKIINKRTQGITNNFSIIPVCDIVYFPVADTPIKIISKLKQRPFAFSQEHDVCIFKA